MYLHARICRGRVIYWSGVTTKASVAVQFQPYSKAASKSIILNVLRNGYISSNDIESVICGRSKTKENTCEVRIQTSC